MGKGSRTKGKAGERELARLFSAAGFDARRGQQFSGGPESPDVIVEGVPLLHIECKRSERLRLYEAMEQACADCGEGQLPIVAHRANRRPWLVTVELTTFLARILPAICQQENGET